MNFKELTLASFAAALAISTGCVVDDDPAADTDDTDTATTMTVTETTTNPPTTTGPTTGPTTTDPDTTDTDPTTDTDTDTGDTDTDTDTDDIDPDDYNFREDDAADYTRVDRMGFPALNTALIAARNKDAYNAANPADDVDAAGSFAGDAVATLEFLHSTPEAGDPPAPVPGGVGLNDDLVLANTLLGTSLTPCGVTLMNNSCVAQAVPLAFPDVLLLTTTGPTGFPNGRALEVPVIDIILAAVLIEIGSAADLLAFTDLSGDPDDEIYGLSQSPNDVAFPGAFPYLAPAHE